MSTDYPYFLMEKRVVETVGQPVLRVAVFSARHTTLSVNYDDVEFFDKLVLGKRYNTGGERES